MIQMLGAVAPLAKILFNTIEKSVPDKDLQEKLKAQLQTQLLQSNTAELQAAAKIVEAEAKAGPNQGGKAKPLRFRGEFFKRGGKSRERHRQGPKSESLGKWDKFLKGVARTPTPRETKRKAKQ